MKKYVLGFMFSDVIVQNNVVLIEKKRPDWQAGYVNGVGGKIEIGEDSKGAMVREFKEETGVRQPVDIWECRLHLISERKKWRVYVFVSFVDDSIVQSVRSKTDEMVVIANANNLPDEAMPNLFWMIPLMRDSLKFPIIIYDEGKNG